MQRLRIVGRNCPDGKDYPEGLKAIPNADLLKDRITELVPGAQKEIYEKMKAVDCSFLRLSPKNQVKWFKEKEAKAKAKAKPGAGPESNDPLAKEPGTNASTNG